MKAKLKIKSLDELGELKDKKLSELYSQDGEELSAAGVFEDLMDVAGVAGLNDALGKARKEADTHRKALKGFELDGKPISVDKYRELLGKESELDQKLKLSEGKVNEVVATQAKEFDKERGAWRTERETIASENAKLKRQIINDTVKRSLRDAFIKAKGRAEYADDVERRADEFGVFDNRVYRIDDDGESPKRHPKESLRYYEPDDFMADMVKVKPGWFEGSGGGGAGGGDKTRPSLGVISRDDPAAVLANIDGLAAGKVQAQ